MRVCIVAHGPSAKDKGPQIDACDFVVRMMGWWTFGAENQGNKIDALAYFGWGQWLKAPSMECEHWFTHTWEQECDRGVAGWQRLEFLSRAADLRPIRWLTQELWWRMYDHLGSHPSTGIAAVAMAMRILRPAELVLYGFDSTTPDRPNYADARRLLPKRDREQPPHDMLAEKRAIAEIGNGVWLEEPCATTLIWPDRPQLE